MAGYQPPDVNGYDYNKILNTTTEYKRFNSDYFSGADVRIYFQDIWVDEIISLQFDLQEQVAPIYGYASYTWDKVARGSRLIQGQFTINFKENWYLQSILNSLQSKIDNSSKKSGSYFDTKQFTQTNGATIEQLLSASSGNKNQFDVLADQFEKSLWGTSNNTSFQSLSTEDRSQDTYFYNKNNQADLRDKGFDIVITYGPFNEPNGMTTSESVLTLNNIQLTGVSQQITGDGNPVLESYTFMARDMNGHVQTKG